MNSLISLPKAMALCSHPRRSSHLLNAIKPTSSFHSFHHAFPSRSPIPTHCIPICKGRSRRNCINGDSQPPGEGEADGDRVLRAVLKLYDAIKDKNIGGLSEVFGDECRFRCNFVPLHRSFKGKKQVLAAFSYLMRALGDSIKVVIRHTTRDGMTVGVSWRLEWSKNCLPLGKGFSLHICQVYQGKVLIRNVEMMIEPLFHMQPLVQKSVDSMLRTVEKTRHFMLSEGRTSKTAMYILLATIVLVLLMFFS